MKWLNWIYKSIENSAFFLLFFIIFSYFVVRWIREIINICWKRTLYSFEMNISLSIYFAYVYMYCVEEIEVAFELEFLYCFHYWIEINLTFRVAIELSKLRLVSLSFLLIISIKRDIHSFNMEIKFNFS